MKGLLLLTVLNFLAPLAHSASTDLDKLVGKYELVSQYVIGACDEKIVTITPRKTRTVDDVTTDCDGLAINNYQFLNFSDTPEFRKATLFCKINGSTIKEHYKAEYTCHDWFICRTKITRKLKSTFVDNTLTITSIENATFSANRDVVKQAVSISLKDDVLNISVKYSEENELTPVCTYKKIQ